MITLISKDRSIYIPKDLAVLKVQRKYCPEEEEKKKVQWAVVAYVYGEHFIMAYYPDKESAIADVECMLRSEHYAYAYFFGDVDDTNNSSDNEESE